MSPNDKLEDGPEVVLTPGVRQDIEGDPELAKFLQRFVVDAKNAMQAVKDGRHESFDKAMEALGYEASAFPAVDGDEEEDDEP